MSVWRGVHQWGGGDTSWGVAHQLGVALSMGVAYRWMVDFGPNLVDGQWGRWHPWWGGQLNQRSSQACHGLLQHYFEPFLKGSEVINLVEPVPGCVRSCCSTSCQQGTAACVPITDFLCLVILQNRRKTKNQSIATIRAKFGHHSLFQDFRKKQELLTNLLATAGSCGGLQFSARRHTHEWILVDSLLCFFPLRTRQNQGVRICLWGPKGPKHEVPNGGGNQTQCQLWSLTLGRIDTARKLHISAQHFLPPDHFPEHLANRKWSDSISRSSWVI